MKKFLSCLVVFVLLISTMSGTFVIPASAATSGTTGDCTWTLSGDELTISGNGAMGNYYSSTTLPWGTNITSVVIENGVTSIGRYAFSGCDGLTSVTIGNSVTTIGDYAFEYCYFLHSVTIPDSVISIGRYAFYSCESLTSVAIGNGVTTIGDLAFYCCDGLTSVTIPDSVTTIGSGTFYGCDGLTSVTIPDSVTSIGYSAFYCCYSLTSVTIPDSVTSIGNYAFWGCDGLISVTIPDSVTTIGNSAFEYCVDLRDVWYTGSTDDRKSIAIGKSNEPLVDATWHYNTGATGTKWTNPFKDVKKSDFYYTPVLWAVANKVTSGTSATTFEPNAACTRGQIVTFLWRAAGSPAPKRSHNPFKDVGSNQYYYKAVLWAVENGITSGASATTFEPNAACTRGQIVTFLWRAAGSPAPKRSHNPFKDVGSNQYYYKAVLWAVENGITAGTSATTFEPNAACTRGQIVTFLYRSKN